MNYHRLLCGKLSLAAVSGLLVAISSMTAASAADFRSGGIYYDYHGSELHVTSGAYEYYGEVTVPEQAYDGRDWWPVTGVDAGAFSGCSDLTSVTLPEGVVVIGESAFRNCTSLEAVSIPRTVESIGMDAFRGSKLEADCESDIFYVSRALVSVSAKRVEPFFIKSGTTVIADGAFAGCSRLSGVVLPDDLTHIGAMTFADCSALTDVILPLTIERIEASAFYGCRSLKQIELPENLAYLGENALAGCTGLTSVKLYQGNPLKLKMGSNVFAGSTEGCRLLVPEGASDVYSQTPQWADFESIAEYRAPLIGDTNGDYAITVADLTGIINRILGDYDTKFSLQGGDINNDLRISISDLTGLITIMLN